MYFCHRHVLAFFVAASAAPFLGAGCQKQATPEAKPVSAHATPEQGFEEIVTVLKEGLELPGGQASGFSTSSSSASSRFQVHNTVTSKLIPPASSNEPYRGEITVSSQSIYSLRKTAEQEAEDKKDSDNERSDRGTSLLDESDESGSGFSSFDESLVSESPDADKPGQVDIESVQRRADRIDRKYQLEYKNNRWELLTKLDPETEASIENAFERALRLQP